MRLQPQVAEGIMRVGRAGCPVGIVGKQYLVLAKKASTSTIYAYRYLDDQYQETVASKSYSGVFALDTSPSYAKFQIGSNLNKPVFVAHSPSTSNNRLLVTWDVQANAFAVNENYAGEAFKAFVVIGATVYAVDQPGGGVYVPYQAAIGGSGLAGAGVTHLIAAAPHEYDFATAQGGSPTGFMWASEAQRLYHGFNATSDDVLVPFPNGGAATVVEDLGVLGTPISAGRILGESVVGYPVIFNAGLAGYHPWPDEVGEAWGMAGEIRHNPAGTEMVVSAFGATLRTLIPSSPVDQGCPLPQTFPPFEAGPDGANYLAFLPLD